MAAQGLKQFGSESFDVEKYLDDKRCKQARSASNFMMSRPGQVRQLLLARCVEITQSNMPANL